MFEAGSAERLAGEHRDAIASFEHVISLLQGRGLDDELLGRALLSAGVSDVALGERLDLAQRRINAGLSVLEECAPRSEAMGRALVSAGGVLPSSPPEERLRRIDRGIEILESVQGLSGDLAWAWFVRGQVQAYSDKGSDALADLEKAVALYRELPSLDPDQRAEFGDCLRAAARVHIDAGRYEPALAALREAIGHFEAIEPEGLGFGLCLLDGAMCQVLLGAANDDALEAAARIFQSKNEGSAWASARYWLALSKRAHGDVAGAIEAVEESLAWYEGTEPTDESVRSAWRLAESLRTELRQPHEGYVAPSAPSRRSATTQPRAGEAERAAKASSESAARRLRYLNDERFKSEVVNAAGTSVVLFADGGKAASHRYLREALARVGDADSSLGVWICRADSNPAAAHLVKVRPVADTPALVIFRDGEVVHSAVALQPRGVDAAESIVRRALESASVVAPGRAEAAEAERTAPEPAPTIPSPEPAAAPPPAPQPPTSRRASDPFRVFLSYRRSDTIRDARLLTTYLETRLQVPVKVFYDIDSIPPGRDYVEHINEEVASCDVFIALIGPRWLSVTADDGSRRLSDRSDWVRLEVKAALDRKIPVIPLLLDDTEMPSPESLPPSIRTLARRQKATLRIESYDEDFHRLARWLEAAAADRA